MRAHVISMKTPRVPQLVLNSMDELSSTRLSKVLIQALTRSVEETLLWRDNAMLLHCLNSLDQHSIFIVVMVSEFLELTIFDQWPCIANSASPDGAATRRLEADASEITSCSNGPEFLGKPNFPFEVDISVVSSVNLRKIEQPVLVFLTCRKRPCQTLFD